MRTTLGFDMERLWRTKRPLRNFQKLIFQVDLMESSTRSCKTEYAAFDRTALSKTPKSRHPRLKRESSLGVVSRPMFLKILIAF